MRQRLNGRRDQQSIWARRKAGGRAGGRVHWQAGRHSGQQAQLAPCMRVVAQECMCDDNLQALRLQVWSSAGSAPPGRRRRWRSAGRSAAPWPAEGQSAGRTRIRRRIRWRQGRRSEKAPQRCGMRRRMQHSQDAVPGCTPVCTHPGARALPAQRRVAPVRPIRHSRAPARAAAPGAAQAADCYCGTLQQSSTAPTSSAIACLSKTSLASSSSHRAGSAQ